MRRVGIGRLVIPVFAVLATVGAILATPGRPGEILALVVAGAAVVWGGLEPRRLAYLTPVVIAGAALAQSSGQLEPGLFLLSLVAMLVVLHHPLTWPYAVLLAAVVAAPAVFARLQPEADYAVGIWTLGVALPAALGWAIAREARLSDELAEARLALVEQEAAEERRRIARDVHDLVGHGLAAVLVQVASARHVLHRDPEEADRALVAAEEVGRRSLRELRTSVTDLRGEAPPSTTLPGLSDLERLVAESRARGLPVTLSVEGVPLHGEGDSLLGLTAYRIVQEALTNAERHARGCPTEVVVDHHDRDCVVRVLSRGATVRGSAPGFGLRGMRERAEAVRGTVTAGPAEDGWLVEARLPLERP